MELIPHSDFHHLRLVDFVPDPQQVVMLADWEYLDCLWVGEALGFSEWLRDPARPDQLGSLSLDLTDFPAENARRVCEAIHLPLHSGMDYEAVIGVLGKPHRKFVFRDDRQSYEFECGEQWKYAVSCTLLNEDGLIYLTVLAHDNRPDDDGAA